MTGYGCEWLCDEQRKALIAWAEATGEVEELRVFGSRAKGTARSDSDLDLAITTSFGCFVSLADKWAEHLSELTRLDVRISRYCDEQNDKGHTIIDYCQEGSELLFSRPAAPGFARPGHGA